MFAIMSSPVKRVQSKQEYYKSASDTVLLGRAKAKKHGVEVQFKNGSSRDFIFALANK